MCQDFSDYCIIRYRDFCSVLYIHKFIVHCIHILCRRSYICFMKLTWFTFFIQYIFPISPWEEKSSPKLMHALYSSSYGKVPSIGQTKERGKHYALLQEMYTTWMGRYSGIYAFSDNSCLLCRKRGKFPRSQAHMYLFILQYFRKHWIRSWILVKKSRAG